MHMGRRALAFAKETLCGDSPSCAPEPSGIKRRKAERCGIWIREVP